MSKAIKSLQRQNIQLINELNQIKNQLVKVPAALDAKKVIQRPASRLYRFETDIRKWRTALNMVEQITNPVYAELVRLMNEIKDDAIICNAVDIRKSYVLSREWTFKNSSGKVDEKATNFFKKYWFNDFLSWVLDSIWYGYSLLKIGDIENGELKSIELIQRQNTNPKLKKVLATPFDLSSGFYFDDFLDPENNTLNKSDVKDWYILASDSSFSEYEGLYAKVAPYQILHKTALVALGQYIMRFGSPNILVKTDINNEGVLRQIENYLANFNNSSYSIANLTDDIQLIESSGKSSEVFISQMKNTEDLMYKLILGSPLSNEQQFVGSADIRQNLANLYSLKDLKFVEHYVNNELIPKLVRLGCTFLEGIRFDFDQTNKIDPQQQFDQLIALLQTGQFTIDPKFIEDNFGIPVKAVVATLFPSEEQNESSDNVQAA